MRDTVVEENGPYGATHLVGQPQSMIFKDSDSGPFYLTEQEREIQKYPVATGRMRVRKKSRKELLEGLKQRGMVIKGNYSIKQLVQYANNYNLPVETNEEVIRPGWVGATKGLLQVLWERGFVKEEEWRKYTLEGRKSWKDEHGQIKQQYLPYLLRKLIADCTDFKNEKSAMDHLFDELSNKGECRMILLVSPKYHCEIAGEGIEYAWGLFKRWYRSISLENKKGKEKFEVEIKKCIRKVSKNHANRFAARCRRYMLAYLNKARQTRDEEGSLTFTSIEKFVKHFKCHRSTADQDWGFIAQVWRESFLMSRQN